MVTMKKARKQNGHSLCCVANRTWAQHIFTASWHLKFGEQSSKSKCHRFMLETKPGQAAILRIAGTVEMKPVHIMCKACGHLPQVCKVGHRASEWGDLWLPRNQISMATSSISKRRSEAQHRVQPFWSLWDSLKDASSIWSLLLQCFSRLDH